MPIARYTAARAREALAASPSPASVAELARTMACSSSTARRRLAELVAAGEVEAIRTGRTVRYRLVAAEAALVSDRDTKPVNALASTLARIGATDPGTWFGINTTHATLGRLELAAGRMPSQRDYREALLAYLALRTAEGRLANAA